MLAEVDRERLYVEISERVLERLADGQIAIEEAQRQIRKTLILKMRSMWQCRECNAIHVHDGYGSVQSYTPIKGNDVDPVFRAK